MLFEVRPPEQGFCEIWPDADYLKLPLADGGEGTSKRWLKRRRVESYMLRSLCIASMRFMGQDAFRRSLKWRPAGWRKPPAQRDPLDTTSWGTGELIRHALDAGAGYHYW
ncbi:glycerate kinase [Salmonella enterica subsp. enterica serovar Weltevreden]|nr:glycerate kinase [Salmonella enterica subsp. enterica serovar Weltevreden]